MTKAQGKKYKGMSWGKKMTSQHPDLNPIANLKNLKIDVSQIWESWRKFALLNEIKCRGTLFWYWVLVQYHGNMKQ